MRAILGSRQGLSMNSCVCTAQSMWVMSRHLRARNDVDVLSAFTLVLAGIATWDFIRQLRFDIRILTRQRRFQWPAVCVSYILMLRG
jgi:hypothetical protein